MRNIKRKSKARHTIWHHVFMVAYLEVKSLMLFAVGGAVVLVGVFIILLTNHFFVKAVIGMPIILMGIALAFINLQDIFLDLVAPKRIMGMCLFCQNPQ